MRTFVRRIDCRELEPTGFLSRDVQHLADETPCVPVPFPDRCFDGASDLRLEMPVGPFGAPPDHALQGIPRQLDEVDGGQVPHNVAVAFRNLATPTRKDDLLKLGKSLVNDGAAASGLLP